MVRQLHAGAGPEALTMGTTIGGSAKRMIMATIHTLLSDSAYARRAEKAENEAQYASMILRMRLNSPLIGIRLSIVTAA